MLFSHSEASSSTSPRAAALLACVPSPSLTFNPSPSASSGTTMTHEGIENPIAPASPTAVPIPVPSSSTLSGIKRQRFYARQDSPAAVDDVEDEEEGEDGDEDGFRRPGMPRICAPPTSPCVGHPSYSSPSSTRHRAHTSASIAYATHCHVAGSNARQSRSHHAPAEELKPPPRKRPHFDLQHEDVGRFASLTLQHSASTTSPAGWGAQGPAPIGLDEGMGMVAVDPPPPPVVPPCSPERSPAPVHNLNLTSHQPQRTSDVSSLTSPLATSATNNISGWLDLDSSAPGSGSSTLTSFSSGSAEVLNSTLVTEPVDAANAIPATLSEGIGEVSMREQSGPRSWEYAKDRIWVDSLDSSSSSGHSSDDDGGAESSITSVGGEVQQSSAEPVVPFSTCDGPPLCESFILNPELTRKLEEEAKRRLFAAQQAHAAQVLQQVPPAQAKKARAFSRKPRLFQSLSTPSSGSCASSANTSAQTSRSSSGNVTPNLRDATGTAQGHALVLWRSPEEVLQSSNAHIGAGGGTFAPSVHTPSPAPCQMSGERIAAGVTKQQQTPRIHNVMDFSAASAALQACEAAQGDVMGQTLSATKHAEGGDFETRTNPVLDGDVQWSHVEFGQGDAMDVD
ncbi:hypothetical protein K437DRAFT_259297 [Tilletiaria anomala UBC 951]|uniref:Uncharacterized protein n=1 Tax=Tilletiaria anomala (strain ATCC 24038 / CBS 436.72 / UBC 951) TaxID=1037660 RepID=A0A066VJN8_TILAU|nr:uncharacterized protein K437DRAFT_259297 [Tilletiaria anomala UBC 951]KDN38800.1 hypothetical protein K437DRAFT_259297 [Tilletiaria anomala UBC 951]